MTDHKALAQELRSAFGKRDCGSVGTLLMRAADALLEVAEDKGPRPKWCDESGDFAEGCWTEQGGIHLRVENDSRGRAIVIFEAGPGGNRLAAVSIAAFRRARVADAIAARNSTPSTPSALSTQEKSRE